MELSKITKLYTQKVLRTPKEQMQMQVTQKEQLVNSK